jgi:hypothetical protein
LTDGASSGQRITTSASGLFLEDTVLCGFCLGDQKLHFSQIDLNDYYGNMNGHFVSADRHFGYTAQDIALTTQNERGKVMLRPAEGLQLQLQAGRGQPRYLHY